MCNANLEMWVMGNLQFGNAKWVTDCHQSQQSTIPNSILNLQFGIWNWNLVFGFPISKSTICIKIDGDGGINDTLIQ